METAYRLSKLINLNELQSLVQANYTASGMPIGMIDAHDGSILVGAGWQTICSEFHRAHPVTRQRCLDSDASIVEQAGRGAALEYKCQNGLWDIGIPVLVSGQYAATLFLGQFFYDDEIPDRDYFTRQARQFGFDEGAYLATLDRVPAFSRAQVENILTYNQALAAFVSDLATQNLVLQREISERRRAEVALRRSEDEKRMILDNLAELVIYVDPAMSVLWANRAACESAGLGREEVIGRPCFRVWANREEPCAECVINQAMLSRQHCQFEKVSPDGRAWINQGYPVLDEEGHLLGGIEVRLEITQRRRAEEELDERNRLLNTLLDNLPIGVFMVEAPTGRPLVANEQAKDLLGRGILPNASVENMAQVYQAYRWRTGERYPVDQMPIIQGMYGHKKHIDDMEVVRPDGRRSLLEVYGSPVLDRNGQVKASLVSFMDITERWQAEEQLRASRRMLSLVLDSIPQTIFWKDNNLVYLGCNQVFARAVGREHPEQVVGLTDYDLPWPRPEAEAYRADDRAVMESGQSRMHIIEPLQQSDGRRLWIDTSKIPLFDQSGKVSGILGVDEDITERVKIEKALRQSEEQYRELVQSANSIILRWNRAGIITFMNQYGLDFFGYSEAELLGRHVMSTIVPEDESTGRDLRPLIDQVLADPLAYAQNVNENIRHDGRRVWVAWTNRVLTGETGQPIGVLSIGNDITEYRMMEDALREANQTLSEVNAKLAEANQRKDEFLAMLSHELRNPLAPIRNASYVLHVLLPENARVQQQREIIDRQIGHMARLMDDLLDVARITRGIIQLRREPLDLRDIMAQTLESCQPRLADRQTDLVYAAPGQPILVDGDPVRLVQVAVNLLNNAVKFSQPGQRITVELGRQMAPSGGEAYLRVRDAGAGIAPELLPHVFELFVQSDKSLDRTKGGLGLGLTLVHRIIEMHGGRVEARSAGPEHGSEFTVYLPLPSPGEQAEADEVKSGAATDVPSQACARVLVVDDNRDEANSLSELLELWGYEVRTAYDGPTALDEAATFQPGAILLDIGLPYMDGFEVARRLHAMTGFPPPRLVAVTGYGQTEDREQTRAAGFDEHLVKPVDLAALQTLLARLPA